ncbi:hypothetical protein NSK_005012 [Nannochloropsis salina CCMP1776]|jgi:hypothetical protein|uniref:protein xylosyltransferase n=1 Tax=Nannochloropsis salina CCMP1776 TaxID=1027361 RepID=A0A4D9D392_9STRA|nr:hypothetical protein NSK_005012 [Nannochloropsis salina CCMP1776]|eukprot:TFJ83915.1 hypothetical protein NSK_005012 [Nannochloropsis salina CCMP1776]
MHWYWWYPFLVFACPLSIGANSQQQQQQQSIKAHLHKDATTRLHNHARDRLAAMLSKTHSVECAEEVTLAYEAFLTAHITETLLPFESTFVKNQCPRPDGNNTGVASNDTYGPSIVHKLKEADDLHILYIITAHRDLDQVVRLIKALQDDAEDIRACLLTKSGASASSCERNHFVVHIDGKEGPLPANLPLLTYASTSSNVYVMQEGRVNVSWGGFSVVKATLNAISYGFYLKLPFDRVINLSGATYPLATPRQIRATLAQHPLNEQLMFIDPTPNVPNPRVWHYFIECDNQMHRIARFGLPRGVPLRTGSQWFVISRDFAHYLLTDDNFVGPYTAYAQHILIPDENFFATVLKSSPYCHHHRNTNYLHLTFDVWEDEKGAAADPSKCLQPDPRICGRSPLLVRTEEIDHLIPRPGADMPAEPKRETFLFARKFDSNASVAVLDEIDRRLAWQRARERESLVAEIAAASVAFPLGENCGDKGCVANGCTKQDDVEGNIPPEGHVDKEMPLPSVLREHGIALESIQW